MRPARPPTRRHRRPPSPRAHIRRQRRAWSRRTLAAAPWPLTKPRPRPSRRPLPRPLTKPRPPPRPSHGRRPLRDPSPVPCTLYPPRPSHGRQPLRDPSRRARRPRDEPGSGWRAPVPPAPCTLHPVPWRAPVPPASSCPQPHGCLAAPGPKLEAGGCGTPARARRQRSPGGRPGRKQAAR